MSNAAKTYNKAGLHCELTQLALATGLCCRRCVRFRPEDATLSTVTVQEGATPSRQGRHRPFGQVHGPADRHPKTVQVDQ